MHYFAFNIGDYASHTHHLDLMEDLAYRRLLDLYYLHERPLNASVTSVARQIGMRAYEKEVETILSEFFELTEDGWINTRADKEIATYHSKIQQASRAGKASAERRSNARSTDVQPTNNHKPITNNQEPDLTGTNVPVRPADAEPAQKLPDCDHQAVRDLYHQILPNLPACEVWNETRAGYLRQRWREVAADMAKENPSTPVTKDLMLDFWRRYFTHVSRSKFLTGKAPAGKDRKPFLADLEWIIRPTNFAKIIENRYHGE